MLKETATVVKTEGEFAWVETARKSACQSCSVNKGCGTAVLSKVVGNKTTQLKVVNQIGAQVGDEVTVGIHEAAMLRGAVLIYLLPLLGLFGFALLGEILSKQLNMASTEVLVIISGMVGLGLSLFWVKGYTARIATDSRYQPVILDPQEGLYSREGL